MQLPADIPPDAAPFLERMGFFEPDRIRPGDAVTPLVLHTVEGKTVELDALYRERGLALFFGSYT
jgi:hypothetical protein